MFDIKGLRTFAMSAKDLNKAVEFYTNVLGGQITRRVEPTEDQLKAGQVKEVELQSPSNTSLSPSPGSKRSKI
jgi:catechol-2,3-dioxygenase